MGLPRKLINLNAYVDGASYFGRLSEFEQPKLAIATEDWRGAGMLGPVKIDMGLEALEATLTFGGHEATLNRYFGTTAVDGVPIRLVSAYRSDDGSPAQAVEIFLAGRFSEIDEGKSKAHDQTDNGENHNGLYEISFYGRVFHALTPPRGLLAVHLLM